MPKKDRSRTAKRMRKMKAKTKIANIKNQRGNRLKSAKSAKIDRIVKKMPTRSKAKIKLLMLYTEKPDFKEMYK